MTLHSDDPGFLALDLARFHFSPAQTQGGAFRTAEERIAAMRRIAARVAKLPVLDDRSPDEILGYDESGLPT